jgi:hypothetical protein
MSTNQESEGMSDEMSDDVIALKILKGTDGNKQHKPDVRAHTSAQPDTKWNRKSYLGRLLETDGFHLVGVLCSHRFLHDVGLLNLPRGFL